MVGFCCKSFQSFYHLFGTKSWGCSFFNLLISYPVWTCQSFHWNHPSFRTQFNIRKPFIWTDNLWATLTKTRCHNSSKKDPIKTAIIWDIWARPLIYQLINKNITWHLQKDGIFLYIPQMFIYLIYFFKK